MGPDLGMEKVWAHSIPFPQLLLEARPPKHTPCTERLWGNSAGQTCAHQQGQGAAELEEGPEPHLLAPDPCPGGKLKIYLLWEKANDPPHPHTSPLEAGAGASQPSPGTGQCPATAITYPRH